MYATASVRPAVRRPAPRPVRRNGSIAGHVAAAVFWFVVLMLVNVAPGWHSLPFLSASAGSLVWLVNLCIVARMIAHLVGLVDGAGRYRPIGDYLIPLLDMVVAAEILLAFPFDFSSEGSDGSSWAIAVRILLLTAVVVSGLRAAGASGRVARMIRALWLKPRSA